MEDHGSFAESSILKTVDAIESDAVQEYVNANDIEQELASILNAFFDAQRDTLPENPFPEITKRFRLTEARVRREKCQSIVNSTMNQNAELFRQSPTTQKQEIPMQLFGKTFVSVSSTKHKLAPRRAASTNSHHHNRDEDDDDHSELKREVESQEGQDQNLKDMQAEKDEFKLFGLDYVVNKISDIHWAEGICRILQPILSPIQVTMDECSVNKISLISAPIFFYDPQPFLSTLARQHILFSHLFPSTRQCADSEWPYFMCCGQIDCHHHVACSSGVFQKSMSSFIKIVQQQIYWLSVQSKKSAEYRFFFKHLIVDNHDRNQQYWTFREIKENRTKFEVSIKHAVVQKHAIRMIFYFVGPDDTLLFECETWWHFHYRQPPNPQPVQPEAAKYNQIDAMKDAKRLQWNSFSINSHFTCYHGLFVNEHDVAVYIDLFEHLETEINEVTFGTSFADWQLQDWRDTLDALNQMKYGTVVAYIYKFAVLVDSTNLDRKKFEGLSQTQIRDRRLKIDRFRDEVLQEMRLTLYSQGQLFQGFMNCCLRMMEMWRIFDRELNEHEQQMREQQQRRGTVSESNNNQLQEADYRVAGQWMHKVIHGVVQRFNQICDLYYPLNSEYMHCIPRIKFLLARCMENAPPWTDWRKMVKEPMGRSVWNCCSEVQTMFDMLGDTMIRDELGMCISARKWIQKRRELLNYNKPNLAFKPTENRIVIQDAIEYNTQRRQFPTTIIRQATLLQYAVETELDRWFSDTLFDILSSSHASNPYIKMTVEAQKMALQFESYKQSDAEITDEVINIDEIELVENETIAMKDIHHLYTYQGLYGYISALLFVDAKAMQDLHEDMISHIPMKVMRNELHLGSDSRVFLSFCGEVAHYPHFDIGIDHMDMIQTVAISGSSFEDVVDTFATHCWLLTQSLFNITNLKHQSSVIFISLNIGFKEYGSEVIRNKNNESLICKMIIQAAKSRQAINLELKIASDVLNQYISVTLHLYLIYHESVNDWYRLCWPFQTEVIFTSIFFEIDDAITFWRAYSVGNIESEYNSEHKDYRRELAQKLQDYHASCDLDEYLHVALRYKALYKDCSGVVEIYRLFDKNTMCGMCIEALKQLRLAQTLLDSKKMCPYFKHQMNSRMLNQQIKGSLHNAEEILFSDAFTFFDRTILRYLTEHGKEEDDETMADVVDVLIKVMNCVKSPIIMACTSWLTRKNENMLISI